MISVDQATRGYLCNLYKRTALSTDSLSRQTILELQSRTAVRLYAQELHARATSLESQQSAHKEIDAAPARPNAPDMSVG